MLLVHMWAQAAFGSTSFSAVLDRFYLLTFSSALAPPRAPSPCPRLLGGQVLQPERAPQGTTWAGQPGTGASYSVF